MPDEQGRRLPWEAENLLPVDPNAAPNPFAQLDPNAAERARLLGGNSPINPFALTPQGSRAESDAVMARILGTPLGNAAPVTTPQQSSEWLNPTAIAARRANGGLPATPVSNLPAPVVGPDASPSAISGLLGGTPPVANATPLSNLSIVNGGMRQDYMNGNPLGGPRLASGTEQIRNSDGSLGGYMGTAMTPTLLNMQGMGYERNPNGNFEPIGTGTLRAANPLNTIQDLIDQGRRNRPAFDQSPEGREASRRYEAGIVERGQGNLSGLQSNLLAQQTNELAQLTARGGALTPGGPRVRGSIENAQIDADTRREAASNTPRAEDVAADQAAEAAIRNMMAQRGFTSETDALAELQRQNPNFRPPRRLGGPGGPSGHSPDRTITNPPNGTTPPGTTGGTTTPPPGVPPTQAQIDAARAQSDLVAQRARVAAMIESANGVIPQVPNPSGQGGTMRSTYSQSPDQFHRAITRVMENVPEDYLRRDGAEFQRQLAANFGGQEALDNWLKTSNIPLQNFMSPEAARQQRAISRYNRIMGQERTPITPMTEGAGMFPRILSAYQYTPLGAAAKLFGAGGGF